MIPRCDTCSHSFLPPRKWCPKCGADTVQLVQTTGKGVLYSFSTIERPSRGSDEPAYTIGLADLDDLSPGSRFYGRVFGVEASELRIGAAIRVEVREITGAKRLPVIVFDRPGVL